MKNKEHPVETAFREHAQQFHCESFSMGRSDAKKENPLANDYWLAGNYTWCGRNYYFSGPLVAPPRESNVTISGLLKKTVSPSGSAAWAELVRKFSDTGIGISMGDEDLVLGGALTLCTLNLNAITVNWASLFIDKALVEIERGCSGMPTVHDR
jgi:hypothetical protein